MREPGEPEVRITMTPDGVRLKMETVMRGDDSDWTGDRAGTWLVDMWERALTLARMQHDYGVEIEGFTAHPVPTSIAPPPFPIPEESPPPSFSRQAAAVQQEERARLDALIERGQENGTMLPVRADPAPQPKKLYGAAAAALDEKLLTLLANAPHQGMAVPEILRAMSEYAEGSVRHRLYGLREVGKITYARTPYWGKTGGYMLAQPSPREAEAEPAREHQHLRQVRAVCRGRVLLMIGGDPQPERAAAIVEALQCAELRWPLFEEKDPIEKRLREIRRPEVELVLINRFNRRYSRHYQHEARAHGKVVVILEAGLGVNQIVEQLWQQFACRIEMHKLLKESNMKMVLTA